nr:hypothetical protein CFP56_01263 [Quercus suber]
MDSYQACTELRRPFPQPAQEFDSLAPASSTAGWRLELRSCSPLDSRTGGGNPHDDKYGRSDCALSTLNLIETGSRPSELRNKMSAGFIFPPNGNFSIESNNQTINAFDTLYIQYSSSWSALNLTLFCTESTTDLNYWYWNVPSNPISPAGTYAVGTIESAGSGTAQYPTTCHFKLTQYGDNDNGISGEVFSVTSQAASSTTYQPTSSSAASTQAASSTTHQPTSTSAASLSDATTSPTTTLSSAAASAVGLSTGAEAGIGIGVVAAIFILAAIAFICFRRRQKRKSTVPYRSPEKAAYFNQNPNAPLLPIQEHTDTIYQKTDTFVDQRPPVFEMSDSSRAELYDSRNDAAHPHELYDAASDAGRRHELSS